MLRVSDCIRDGIRLAQATERQRIGNQIDAAMIFARPDFLNVYCLSCRLKSVPRRDQRHESIWIAAAHRDDGKRFVVHADELLTAFLELETVAGGSLRFPNSE
jgi:hypothetical protein